MTEYQAKYLKDRVNYSILEAQQIINKREREHSADRVSPYRNSKVFTGPNVSINHRIEQTQQIELPDIKEAAPKEKTDNFNHYSTIDNAGQPAELLKNYPPISKLEMQSESTQKEDMKMTNKCSDTDEISRGNYGPPHIPEGSSMYSPIKLKQRIGLFLPSQYEDPKEVNKRKLANFKKSIEQSEKIQAITRRVLY